MALWQVKGQSDVFVFFCHLGLVQSRFFRLGVRVPTILSTTKNVDRKFVDKICRKKICRFDKFEFQICRRRQILLKNVD